MSEPYRIPVNPLKVPARYEKVQYEDVPEDIRVKFEKMKETRKGLYIYGDVGVGKTHIAYALYRYSPFKAQFVVEENSNYGGEPTYRRVPALFWNTTELFREIRLDFDRPREERARSEDHLMYHEGILFIDDIGSEKPSEWVLETFYLIVNKRYNEKLPIVFTSNLSIKELADRLGGRIASRITETCDIIKIGGVDRRLNMPVDKSS